MSSQSARPVASRQYPCEASAAAFARLSCLRKQELSFGSAFKRGELADDKGATVLVEGSHSAHLYTVLSGWAFRYKLLSELVMWRDGGCEVIDYDGPKKLARWEGARRRTQAADLRPSPEPWHRSNVEIEANARS